ncbi:MAG: MarR family transcriptional regulator [Deltaproteobacteria bacterium]|nr:MarR family transcriptional regulator [Deltaproteobacteria bacterium]
MKPIKPASGRELHEFFHEVFHLQAMLSQIVDAVHERAGMRTPQIRLAETLEAGGKITVPEAAARLEVSRQFVQTLCNEMVDLGWLAFSENPRHKRSKLVSLSKRGREKLNQAKRIEAEIIEQGEPPVHSKAVRDATSLAVTLRQWLQEAVEKFACNRAGD